jgi:hypothetical protein
MIEHFVGGKILRILLKLPPCPRREVEEGESEEDSTQGLAEDTDKKAGLRTAQSESSECELEDDEDDSQSGEH